MGAGATDHYQNPYTTAAANDVFAIAIDLDAGKYWLARNNVWYGSGDPGAGINHIMNYTPATVGGALFPAMSFNGAGQGVWTLQSTAASQKYAPPSGFMAWDGGVAPPPTSVWSSSDATANGVTLTNNGLTVSSATITGGWKSTRNTTSHTSGKWYVELLCNASVADGNEIYGFGSSGMNPLSYIGASNYSGGVSWAGNNLSAGFTSNYTTTLPTAANDVWAFAIDFTSGGIWIAQNNVWKNGSNPATGSLPIISFTPATVGALFAAVSFYAAGQVWTLQSTAASQKYAPPSGFSAWDGGAVQTPSQAYLARTVGGNEGGNGANIATLIDGLVSDGVWAKLDALYVLAQQNRSDALLNLVGTSYPLTENSPGNLVFTSHVGFSGFNGNSCHMYFEYELQRCFCAKSALHSQQRQLWRVVLCCCAGKSCCDG